LYVGHKRKRLKRAAKVSQVLSKKKKASGNDEVYTSVLEGRKWLSKSLAGELLVGPSGTGAEEAVLKDPSGSKEVFYAQNGQWHQVYGIVLRKGGAGGLKTPKDEECPYLETKKRVSGEKKTGVSLENN